MLIFIKIFNISLYNLLMSFINICSHTMVILKEQKLKVKKFWEAMGIEPMASRIQ